MEYRKRLADSWRSKTPDGLAENWRSANIVSAPPVDIVVPAVGEASGEASVDDLKERLLASARAFKDAQEAKWESEEASESTFATSGDVGAATKDLSEQVDERLASPLKAEGFGNVELGYDETLGRLRNETVALIEEIALLNPTPVPFDGWREHDGECKLTGTWRLLFTTGADATFKKTKSTGKAVTFQKIDAKGGYFVNSVDFPFASDNKLKGFRVVVKGKRLSDNEVQLKFRRVKLLRRSRFLRTLVIPLPPSGLLRAVARWASRGKAQLSNRGAGFQMLYLDDDLRMHKTFDGQYFVQQRCRYEYR